MPSPQFVPLTPPSLPPGYCYPSSPQQFATDLFSGAFGVIPASVGLGFNYGQSVPGVNDTNKPWVKLNPDNSLEGIYTFAFGKWTRPYWIPAGPNQFRSVWVGTLSDLYNFDGGDGFDPTVTPPTQVTGSFWEQDLDFAARTMLGVGTLPISTVIVNVGDTGGADQIQLLLENLTPHTHQAHAADQTGDPNNTIWGTSPNGSTAQGVIYPGGGGLGGPNANPIATTLRNTGGDTSIPNTTVAVPHDNMPPFKAVYVVKRTGRTHIAI